jgi:cytidylate kinase
MIIAIDGTSASGKTTLARRLAARLGYLYFDTGVMYRALTLAALRQGLSMSDEPALSSLAAGITIDVTSPTAPDGRPCTVLLDGEDVTWTIRSPEVDASVSQASIYPGVRTALTLKQRRIGLRGRVVMVGRDIGTVVLPEAELKFFVTASIEERARRRLAELTLLGEIVGLAEVERSLAERDRIDSQRAVAPLRAAPDAVVVDTTHLSAESVLDLALELVDKRGRAAPAKNARGPAGRGEGGGVEEGE